jgi:prepilin-type N-terminal cleavage/methylation domain-containing protein
MSQPTHPVHLARRARLGARGFTLVELLIALTLLLALVAMASGIFRGNVDEARERVREANLRAIRKAIHAFYNDYGRYPYNGQDKLGNVVQFLDNGSSELVQGVHDTYGHYPATRSRYLREIPIDPTTDKADWILIPCDNDADWRATEDDEDGDGRPSINQATGRAEPNVDEDGFGGSPQNEDADKQVDEDPPDVMDVLSRGP